MPSLQDIRQFNQRLVRLGNEPEVVAGWGEELEDVDEPESGLDSDLTSLLSDTGTLGDDDFAGGPSAEADAVAPDFSELIAEEIPDDHPGEEVVESGEGLEESFGEEFEPPGLESSDAEFADDEFTGAELGDLGVFSEHAVPDAPDDIAPVLFEIAEDDSEGLPDEELTPDQEEFDLSQLDDEFAMPEVADFDDGPDDDQGELSEDLSGLTDQPEDFADTEFPDAGDDPDAEVPDLGDLDFDEADGGAPDLDGFDSDDEAAEDIAGLGDLETAETDFDIAGTDDFDIDDAATEFPDSDDSISSDLEAQEIPGDDNDLPDEGFDFSDDDFTFTDEDVEPAPSTPRGDYSFDAPNVPGEESDDADDLGGFDFDEDSLGDTDDDIDEFSLGDFGDEFGVIDDAGPSDEDLNPAVSVPEIAPGVPIGPPGTFQISDGDFQLLRQTMVALPLNLRADVQDIIAEAKGTTEQAEKLVRMLVAGASAQDIATAAGRILDKQIRIPRGYEKRSGASFEQERASFGYQFRENILPVIRVVGLFALAVATLTIGGYHLVFRPLYARSLYRTGLAQIQEDQYSLANETFERAWDVWTFSRWYYDYADAFVAKRQYSLAEEKYRELLFTRNPEVQQEAVDLLAGGRYADVLHRWAPEPQGILDYAALKSEILGDYPGADSLLSVILVRDTAHYDARLAAGDNYMRWAEDDPTRFEDARLSYSRLLDRYGHTDELLFRMLRYFIATDNLKEVVRLKDVFQADPGAAIEPDAYARLGGYLIDNDLLDDVEAILFRALDVDNTLAEIHYELARHYRLINAEGEEELALATAVRLLGESEPLSPDRRGKLVDSLTRQAENLYDVDQYLTAEEKLTRAIEIYETGLRQRSLEPGPMYGRAYAKLADIYYYVGRQYEDALLYYNSAETNGYSEPNLDYKQGFIHYRMNEVNAALAEFREAERDPSGVTNALIWAIANTHYRRRNFHAAEAYYRDMVDRALRQRDSIRTLLLDEDTMHQSTIAYMIRAYNNLGITLNRLFDETNNAERYSEGLYYLTLSTEYAENYGRDPATLIRSEAVDLAFLNIREILYPRPEYDLLIYNDIPEDLDDLVF